jgi:hypothetical protein
MTCKYEKPRNQKGHLILYFLHQSAQTLNSVSLNHSKIQTTYKSQYFVRLLMCPDEFQLEKIQYQTKIKSL